VRILSSTVPGTRVLEYVIHSTIYQDVRTVSSTVPDTRDQRTRTSSSTVYQGPGYKNIVMYCTWNQGAWTSASIIPGAGVHSLLARLQMYQSSCQWTKVFYLTHRYINGYYTYAAIGQSATWWSSSAVISTQGCQYTARNLGVVVDSQLSMSAHVAAVSRSGYYQLRQLRPLMRCMMDEAIKTLMHAFICSRLDYCNVLFCGVAEGLLSQPSAISL